MTQHVAVPAAADAFFTTVRGTTYNLDNVACVMSGIIPAFGFVLDVKLWTLFEATISKRASGLVLKRCTIGTKRKIEGVLATPTQKRILRVWSALGLGYMGLTIAGSYAFLRLTEATMTNDFWWATFDLNNTQAYLCNRFNAQLITSFGQTTVRFNDLERALLVTMENTTDPNINVAPAYANLIQDQVNSLPNVISALRNMNGCDLQWIFTAYCYVDFAQKWELANSLPRQERCRHRYATNGAVYLEGLFRNNHDLALCWSEAWENAVFRALHEFNDDKNWLNKTFSAQLSIDEVQFWQDHEIKSYSAQWQNFKLIGVIETVDVVRAFGFVYPLTLKRSNKTLQLSKQTSYKTYWGLAGDLTAISTNGSTIYGQSLVRQASNFAFRNVSLEAQLMANQTLPAPLTDGLSLLRSKLGPFGSTDTYRVAVPLSLVMLYENLTQTVTSLLAQSIDAQVDYWPLYDSTLVCPQPSEWDDSLFWGGDILCREQPSPQPQVQLFFSSQGSCGINVNEFVQLTPHIVLMAAMTSGLVHRLNESMSINAICRRATNMAEACKEILLSMKAIAEKYFTQDRIKSAYSAALQIKLMDVDIQLFQYISRRNSPISISTPRLFDDIDFEIFAWIMLFEWTQGFREVVTFEGDVGQLTLMSTLYTPSTSPANAIEVPLNMALYVHRVMQYCTLVLLGVAAVAGVYIIHSRSYVQGLNLFSFNRVARLVWLGRPTAFVRGITAICLLSTASLELRRPHSGLIAFLDAPPTDPIKTFFSAGEATWLAYILNDLFSLVTRQYTSSYSLKSRLLLWAAAATWSFVSPVTHSVTISRDCTVVLVDSQIVCHSGVVRIGNNVRFIGLILLAISSQKSSSLFLYAAAKYQFRRDQWEFLGVYYLDRASAVLNGIISVTFKGFHFVFDIKTWRIYVYPVERHIQTSPFISDMLSLCPNENCYIPRSCDTQKISSPIASTFNHCF
ncbi:hypothetical protein LEN26_019773 [Aphanomyces euteiches]|nr:hypothetical protein LEN26_019773 [Aphanomyces euteiches]